MKFIEWNDSYSVGNPLMDAHHRIFFRMVRQFGNAQDTNSRDAMKQRIAFLVSYVAMHLTAEERLLQEAGYADLAQHKAVHDAFARKMHAIEESFLSGKIPVTADEILQAMQDWLLTHILTEVREQASCFQPAA